MSALPHPIQYQGSKRHLFIEKAQAVTAKRPKTVIDHILAHGQITTDELKVTYGYNHPPCAAQTRYCLGG